MTIFFDIIQHMKEGLKERVVSFLTYGVLALIIVGGLAMMYPDFLRSKSLKRQNEDLQAQIEAKKHEISVLMENQRRFRTDADFVEMIARQNHRVFPGELVFIFEKN